MLRKEKRRKTVNYEEEEDEEIKEDLRSHCMTGLTMTDYTSNNRGEEEEEIAGV